jgi:hypothetical protein
MFLDLPHKEKLVYLEESGSKLYDENSWFFILIFLG